MIKLITKSPEETASIGYKLGSLLKAGDILCMDGDLGAGKTTMTQSITKGLEVDDYVTSPTFTIVNEYMGRVPVYHFDVYRIGDVDEMYDIGFDEYIHSEGVCIIEWSKIIEEILPENRLEIKLNRRDEENVRELSFIAYGERYEQMIEELMK